MGLFDELPAPPPLSPLAWTALSLPLLWLFAEPAASCAGAAAAAPALPRAHRALLRALPGAALALHPLALHALAVGEARAAAEGVALLAALAAAECAVGAAARRRALPLLLALPAAALALAAAARASPVQGACLALALAPRLLLLPLTWRRGGGEPSGALRVGFGFGEAGAPAASAPLALAWLLAAAFSAWHLLLGATAAGGVGARPADVLLRTLRLDLASPLPEMSPTWYLFSSVFLRQMPFFAACVWLHAPLYALPLALRLWWRPRVAAVASLALAALFDPSGAASPHRLPLVLALVLACPNEAAEMRGFLPLALHCFSLAVSPAMKWLWLGAGSGNANFMLNQHLLFAVSSGALVAEFVLASLRLRRRARARARLAEARLADAAEAAVTAAARARGRGDLVRRGLASA